MASSIVVALESLFSPVNIGVAIVSALIITELCRFYTDPLGHIPGPFIARLTPLWLWKLTWSGVECRTIAALHEKYGPVVRIAPNEVDISDGVAIYPVYIRNGGFLKSPIYQNYDVNGSVTIFSGLDPGHRAIRAKAVTPIFAQKAVASGRPAVQSVADGMVTELERRKDEACGEPVDVLNLFRALALDTVTTYLCGESYGSVGKQRLSATAFVDDFVAGGRFFYLPGWIFNHVSDWAAKLDKNKVSIVASTEIIEQFATRVVDRSMAEEKGEGQTYQGRLLRAGISRDETIAQVIDIMFAGTDAAGMTMSLLACELARHPDKYEHARKELLANPDADPQCLPYLTGIIKESLRLSNANPTRFPRIVPSPGLEIPGLPTIPAGTSVGLGAYILHLNSDVFPEPQKFLPERWLNPTPEMLRDSFYFGAGARQCIARNLASAGLYWSAEALIRSDLLRGARPVDEKIEILEWFNAKVVKGKIELRW
ncbi:cytochrome P450 [Lasiosphaeria ovina]|uniref:Cytochrome P450 n=1 Tax=Lasiosphaeria ovina TaxID=92902 RepID=A0AAE0KC26_9PEZI|nr:cytochrome P450 [Lasiosphaeria ovina]